MNNQTIEDFWNEPTFAKYMGNEIFNEARPQFVMDIEDGIVSWEESAFKTNSLELGKVSLVPTGIAQNLSTFHLKNDSPISDVVWTKFNLQIEKQPSNIAVYIESTERSGIIFVNELSELRRYSHFNYGSHNDGTSSHRSTGAEYMIAQGHLDGSNLAKPTSFVSDNRHFHFSLKDDSSQGQAIMKEWSEVPEGGLIASGVYNSSGHLMNDVVMKPLGIIASKVSPTAIKMNTNINKVLTFVAEKEKEFFNKS